MPGFWKRPITRMYAYNLDVGEHYYWPMKHYLEVERPSYNVSPPGALTYSERLARRWLYGRQYEPQALRYSRASSVGARDTLHEAQMLARATRAASEVRSSAFDAPVSAWANREALLSPDKLPSTRLYSSSADYSSSAANTVCSRASRATSRSVRVSESAAREQTRATSFCRSEALRRRIDDDVVKKVADVHMMPWSAHEREEASSASARARARINDLERELDEITRKCMMTSTHALKTASQLAKQAMAEDEAALSSSYKKSRRVMVESGSKIA